MMVGKPDWEPICLTHSEEDGIPTTKVDLDVPDEGFMQAETLQKHYWHLATAIYSNPDSEDDDEF